MLAITGGTDDTTSTVTNSSSLVFGIMGVGTFLMFFFFVVVILIWIFSTPCGTASKVLSRIISVVIFVAVFLILIFADHESQFAQSTYEQEVWYLRPGSIPFLNKMMLTTYQSYCLWPSYFHLLSSSLSFLIADLRSKCYTQNHSGDYNVHIFNSGPSEPYCAHWWIEKG